MFRILLLALVVLQLFAGNGNIVKTHDETNPIQVILVRIIFNQEGGNWYAYCGGDPVNRSDPTGLDWVWQYGLWKWDGKFDGEPMSEDEAIAEGITKPTSGPHDTTYWGELGLPPGDDGQFRVGADIDYIFARAYGATQSQRAFDNEYIVADPPISLFVMTADSSDLRQYRERFGAYVYDLPETIKNRRIYGSLFHEVSSIDPNPPPLPKEFDLSSEAVGLGGVIEPVMAFVMTGGLTPRSALRDLASAATAVRAGGAWAGREAAGAGGRFVGGFAAGWRDGPRLIPSGVAYTGKASLALINAAVKASKGLAEGATSAISKRLSHSRILGRNLAGESLLARPAGTSAHHIVAWDDPRAAGARSVLQRFGIGVDEAANGVFLPRSLKFAGTGTAHSTVHTNAYYQRINDLMSGASTRTEAIDTLLMIRNRLKNEMMP